MKTVLSFFSVGHGLYHACKFYVEPDDKKIFFNPKQSSNRKAYFTYIYDCGSSCFKFDNDKSFGLKGSIDSSLSFYDDVDKIDVLFVTHFHQDHVNKLKELIPTLENKRICIERIVVPYVDLYNRLLMYLDYDINNNHPVSAEVVNSSGKAIDHNALSSNENNLNYVLHSEENDKNNKNAARDANGASDDQGKGFNDDNYDFDYLKFIINPYQELLNWFEISKPSITVLKNPSLSNYYLNEDGVFINKKITNDDKKKQTYQYNRLKHLKNTPRSSLDMQFILSDKEFLAFEFDELNITDAHNLLNIHVFLPPIRQKPFDKNFFTAFRAIVKNLNSIDELFAKDTCKKIRSVYLNKTVFDKTKEVINLTSLLVCHSLNTDISTSAVNNSALLLGDTKLDEPLKTKNKGQIISRYIKDHIVKNGFNCIKVLLIPHHGSQHSWSEDIKNNLSNCLCVVSGSIGNENAPHESVLASFNTKRSCYLSSNFVNGNQLGVKLPITSARYFAIDCNGNTLLWANERQCIWLCFDS